MIRRDSCSMFPLLLTLIAAASGGCTNRETTEATEVAASQQALTAAKSATPRASGAGATMPAKPAPGTSGARASTKPTGATFAPGQLVVKFKSDGQAGVTDDVRTCLAQGRSFATITADSSPSLDAHVKHHGIFQAASLVHGREGLTTATAKAQLRSRAQNAATAKARSTVVPVEDLVNVYRLDLPTSANLEAAMQDLRNDPHVEYAHPNYVAQLVYTPNDPYLASSGSWGQPRADLWDMKLMHTEQGWDTTRGSGVVVAVVNTGLDLTHPDIAGNIWTNPGEIPNNGIDDDKNGYIDDVNGWSFLNNSNQVDDGVGHGTHVAGTIAAQDNNGIGIVGVAPDARIMPVQVFSESSDAFTISQGLLYAAQNGADVINNSWELCGDNTSCTSVPVIEDAVRTAHAGGSVVVFAAGNESIDIRYHSPQNQPESVVVTATTPSDTRASFSNFGLVDVAAPGSGDPNDPVVDPTFGILSLKAANCMEPWICDADREVGDAYVRLGGTSMAAPHAAGVAALILGLHPTYSPEQVRQVMRRTSIDANGNGYDTDLGYGRVDTANISAEPTPLEALIQAPLVVQTSSVTIAGSANGDQFQKYVLEYGKGTAPTTWTTLVNSTKAVSSGTLGTWNVSKLADGDYTLRLTAYKNNGAKYDDLHLLTLDRVVLAAPTAQSCLGSGDISITGIASPGTFKSYAIRVQTFDAGTPVNANLTLTNGGTKPVASGVLGVWHTQSVPAGHYRLILDVTNTDGSVISENVILIVDTLLHSGWPVNLTFQTSIWGTTPPEEPIVPVDLDGDGKAEVVAAFGNQVSVFKGDGTVFPGWPQSPQPNSNDLYPTLKSVPVVGDIDGDGLKEVVATTTSGTIVVWGSNGAVKPGWPRSITYTADWGVGTASLSLSLADVDRNGVLDIVATDSQQSGIHVFKGNGSYLPGWPVTTWSGLKSPATVADLNNDGKNEVVVGIEANPTRLVVLSSTGTVLPGWPQTLVNSSNDSPGVYPVVGDLDDDGDLEIAAIATDWDPTTSKIAIYHHTGQRMSVWSTNASWMGRLVLADVDGDGSLEVLASLVNGDNAGGLFVWDHNGNVLPGWPQSNSSYTPMFNAPIVADLDGDGRNEIITSRQDEYWSDELQQHFGYPVQAFHFDGTTVAQLARPAFGAWSGPDGIGASGNAGVADTDGDGRLELVWTEVRDSSVTTLWPRVFAWDLTTPTSNAQAWPMYRADARQSGIAQAVVPLVRLTQRAVAHRVNGLSRFLVHTGSGGVMQLKHPWQAVVKYAVNSDLLKQTTLGWGDQFAVPPNQDVKLRIVTTSPIDVTIDWW